MIALGIETSGDIASLARCDDGLVLAERTFPARMNLCRDLVGEIDSILEALPEGCELRAMAVSLGPGSFTSLRVGVMTAKAMAHRLELPLVGVPTPAALAAPLDHSGRTICVVQPGWKSTLYLTLVQPGDGDIVERVAKPEAVAESEVTERLAAEPGELLAVGEPALAHQDELEAALGERLTLAPPTLCRPSGASVLEAARGKLASAEPGGAFSVTPLYVVASQAERVAGIDLGLSGV